MENEVLIAILTKLVEEKISLLHLSSGPRGPRGQQGLQGKDFVFSEHEETIRSWTKELSLKFEDLTEEQVASLKGRAGRDGRDGKDFAFADYDKQFADTIRDLVGGMDLKLKFSDLTVEDIASLRGPKGRDGRHGIDFMFDDHQIEIERIVKSCIEGMSHSLKLRFSDLSEEEVALLRGPRGRDGKEGRGFILEEHKEYFDSLKLKFSDLTEEEKTTLKLHFSQLTDDEKTSLKLRFRDLTPDDVALLRGPRGTRGQKGSPGREGTDGKTGPRGIPGPRGLIGLTGPKGIEGVDGKDGQDGEDAPIIVAIEVDQISENDIAFVFEFSDGTVIKTDRVDLPAPVNIYGGGGASGGGGDLRSFETRIDEVSASVTYIGKAIPGSTTAEAVWSIQKMVVTGTETSFEWADGNPLFDNIWDNRAGLTYA